MPKRGFFFFKLNDLTLSEALHWYSNAQYSDHDVFFRKTKKVLGIYVDVQIKNKPLYKKRLTTKRNNFSQNSSWSNVSQS